MIYLTFISILLFSFITLGATLIKGADISWVTGQESKGIIFRDTLGNKRDIIDILKKDYQINTIRLRVFVNPSDHFGNGLCDIAATVRMAKRVKNAGLQLMLTLHYSDSWADPGKQNPPAAWNNFTMAQLETAVYNHTKDLLEALSKEGIYPELLQTGNETNNGMLWPNGEAAKNMANYARLINAGYTAVKEKSPTTKTVVHLSFDSAVVRWNIDGLISNKANFDVIGISAYPEYAPNTTPNDWQKYNNKLFAFLSEMIKLYNKPLIISETGMDYREENNCRNMLSDMVKRFKSINNNMVMGLLYWEPQAGPGYNEGYNKGAWGADDRPTRALNGFIEGETSLFVQSPIKNHSPENALKTRNFKGVTIIAVPNDFSGSTISIYSVDGRLVHREMIIKELHCKLSKGTYIAEVYTKSCRISDKLIVVE